jgi:hypothetical protein
MINLELSFDLCHTIHMIATNTMVNEHNTIMLHKLTSEILIRHASDIVSCKNGTLIVGKLPTSTYNRHFDHLWK